LARSQREPGAEAVAARAGNEPGSDGGGDRGANVRPGSSRRTGSRYWKTNDPG